MNIRCKLNLHKFVKVAHKDGVGTVEQCQRCNKRATWIDVSYFTRGAEKEILND